MLIMKGIAKRDDGGFDVLFQTDEGETLTKSYTAEEYQKQYDLMKQALLSNGQPVVRPDDPNEAKIRNELLKLREEMMDTIERQSNLIKQDYETLNKTLNQGLKQRGQVWDQVHIEAEKRLVAIADAIASTKLLGQKALETLADNDSRREEVISKLQNKSEVTWEMAQRSKDDTERIRREVTAYVEEIDTLLEKIKNEKDTLEHEIVQNQSQFHEEVKTKLSEQMKLIDETVLRTREREEERRKLLEVEQKQIIRDQWIEKELEVLTERDNEKKKYVLEKTGELVTQLEKEKRALEDSLKREQASLITEEENVTKRLNMAIDAVSKEDTETGSVAHEIAKNYKAKCDEIDKKTKTLVQEASQSAAQQLQIESKIKQLQDDISTTRDKINAIRDKRKTLAAECKKLEAEQVAANEKQVQDAEAAKRRAEESAATAKNKLATIMKRLSEVQHEMNESQKTLSDERAKGMPQPKQLGPLPSQKEIALRKQADLLKSEAEQLAKEAEQKKTILMQQGKDLKIAKQQIEQVRKERADLEQAQRQAEANHKKQHNAGLAAAEAATKALEKKIADHKKEIEQALKDSKEREQQVLKEQKLLDKELKQRAKAEKKFEKTQKKLAAKLAKAQKEVQLMAKQNKELEAAKAKASGDAK